MVIWELLHNGKNLFDRFLNLTHQRDAPSSPSYAHCVYIVFTILTPGIGLSIVHLRVLKLHFCVRNICAKWSREAQFFSALSTPEQDMENDFCVSSGPELIPEKNTGEIRALF